MKSPPLAMVCHWWVFKYCVSTCFNNISILSSISVTLTMALHMNNNHIRQQHMCTTWSVGSVWSQHSHTVHCWVHATPPSPDSTTQTWSCVHFPTKLLPGGGPHAWGNHPVTSYGCLISFQCYMAFLLPHILLSKLSSIVNNYYLANNVLVSNKVTIQ